MVVVVYQQVEAYLEGVERAKAQALLLLQGRAYPAVRERLEKLLAQHDATATGSSSQAATGEAARAPHACWDSRAVDVQGECGRLRLSGRSWSSLLLLLCAGRGGSSSRLKLHPNHQLLLDCLPTLVNCWWVRASLSPRLHGAMEGSQCCLRLLLVLRAATTCRTSRQRPRISDGSWPCSRCTSYLPACLPPYVRLSDWPDDGVVVVHTWPQTVYPPNFPELADYHAALGGALHNHLRPRNLPRKTLAGHKAEIRSCFQVHHID